MTHSLAGLVFLVITASVQGWDYSDPAHWVDHYPICGGNSQSPIDIDNAEYDATLPTLVLTDYDQPGSGDYELSNNGHSAVVTVSSGMKLTGGLMDNNYTLAQFHFHWGSIASQGSEHTRRGKAYSGELHFVHYNSDKYHSVSEAMVESDGLAVLGVFIKDGDENPAYAPITDNLQYVPHKGDTKVLAPFQLEDLLPQLESPLRFFTYSGSLTTPGCYESVTWNVLAQHVSMSSEQLDKFRALFEHDEVHIVDNFRPVQPLNGRPLVASWQQGA